MEQATLLLSNNAYPSASGFSGGLASTTVIGGVQNLTFQAADNGSGVYQVKAAIDGQTVYQGTPNNNGNECAPVGGYAGSLEFVSAVPCPTSESVTIPLNTATLHDGKHELTVTITDAAGNQSTVYTQILETHNAPAVNEKPNISGIATVGSTLTATNASFTTPNTAGVLSKLTGQWMRCADITATHCSPISQANKLTYQIQSEDVGYYLLYANTASNNDGTTTSDSEPTTQVIAPVHQPSCTGSECSTTSSDGGSTSGSGGPGGPGGSGGAGGNTTTTNALGTPAAGGVGGESKPSITINVPGSTSSNATLLGSAAKWTVTLKAAPVHVRKGTTIKLAGLVTTSPRPTAGKLLYLQARTVINTETGRGRSTPRKRTTYGKWITFASVRTAPDGTWQATYRFRVAGRHTYQMQAVAPQEGDYQNPTGSSPILTITEN